MCDLRLDCYELLMNVLLDPVFQSLGCTIYGAGIALALKFRNNIITSATEVRWRLCIQPSLFVSRISQNDMDRFWMKLGGEIVCVRACVCACVCDKNESVRFWFRSGSELDTKCKLFSLAEVLYVLFSSSNTKPVH